MADDKGGKNGRLSDEDLESVFEDLGKIPVFNRYYDRKTESSDTDRKKGPAESDAS